MLDNQKNIPILKLGGILEDDRTLYLYIMDSFLSGVKRSYGQCNTSPVHQVTRPAHQLLQGQGASNLGCPTPSLHTEVGWDVSQGPRRYSDAYKIYRAFW